MVTVDMVLAAVATIPEPCSIAMGETMNLRSMGLVENVVISGEHVSVELVLTDSSCVHYKSMRALIRAKVLELAGVASVEVTMSTEKLWTPDRLVRR